MKARMEVTLDTTWTNQVCASVECEFDNPHSLTARALVELMVQRLKFMAEEIRHANERTIPALLGENERLDRAGSPERERRAYEDMREERERAGSDSIFEARKEAEERQHG